MDSTYMSAETKYKGVRGWLLLFCISLTILSPFLTVTNLISGIGISGPYFNQFPGLLLMVVIDIMLSTGLMIFSIYAGFALWTVKPIAVQIAKRYLRFFLGYTIISIFLPFMAGLPPEAHRSMMGDVLGSAVRSVAYFLIWTGYLSVSKRVKATYVQGDPSGRIAGSPAPTRDFLPEENFDNSLL